MKEFLNQQMKLHSKNNDAKAIGFLARFEKVTSLIVKNLPPKPFHVRGPLNLAAMDLVMGALVSKANNIPVDLANRFDRLMENAMYQKSIFYNTSDSAVVKERFGLAIGYLTK